MSILHPFYTTAPKVGESIFDQDFELYNLHDIGAEEK